MPRLDFQRSRANHDQVSRRLRRTFRWVTARARNPAIQPLRTDDRYRAREEATRRDMEDPGKVSPVSGLPQLGRADLLPKTSHLYGMTTEWRRSKACLAVAGGSTRIMIQMSYRRADFALCQGMVAGSWVPTLQGYLQVGKPPQRPRSQAGPARPASITRDLQRAFP